MFYKEIKRKWESIDVKIWAVTTNVAEVKTERILWIILYNTI